jgi:hypothetical protein
MENVSVEDDIANCLPTDPEGEPSVEDSDMTGQMGTGSVKTGSSDYTSKFPTKLLIGQRASVVTKIGVEDPVILTERREDQIVEEMYIQRAVSLWRQSLHTRHSSHRTA